MEKACSSETAISQVFVRKKSKSLAKYCFFVYIKGNTKTFYLIKACIDFTS